jgi:hypothetical protein
MKKYITSLFLFVSSFILAQDSLNLEQLVALSLKQNFDIEMAELT